MRFIKGGPDVPERLVQRHEEGRVVFFCGAGISYPAGLPGFQSLIEKIYAGLGESFEAPEKAAMDAQRFDAALDLLERRAPRASVRQQLWNILQPDLTLPGATATHEALLRLARNSDGTHRLITTNFDRIFFKVNPGIQSFQAPLLPIPKKTVWDGLVYLHGLLPATVTEASAVTALNRLIVSSGDFGRAYLTERWASRFVSELFREYSVCFVGYSIGDPVLRYMLDAISADRLQGEEVPEMFAFGAYTAAGEERERAGWAAKGVTPILYRNDKRLGHRYLNATIQQWGDDFFNGRNGQVETVRKHARTIPSKVRGDHVVDRVLWAITHPSGIGARTFSELRPPAPIQWLPVFTNASYMAHDLPRFDVLPAKDPKGVLRFSVLSRPAPYALAPNMSLTQPHPLERRWDDVMFALSQWVVLHLDKRELLDWVIESGGELHPTFREAIRHQLQKPDASSPPLSEGLRVMWRMLSGDRVTSGRHQFESFFETGRNASEFGWTPLVQVEFLRQIRPQVVFRLLFRTVIAAYDEQETPGLHQYANWDLTIPVGNHPDQTLVAVQSTRGYREALVEMLFPLTDLLKQAMDLQAELGQASADSDLSYMALPSIVDHKFNTRNQEWSLLISLCRDAWLQANRLAPAVALAAFNRWRLVDYPLFRRLVFFGAAHTTQIAASQSLDLLFERNGWWLWSNETRREMYRLLQSMAGRLSPEELDRLFELILAGPPPDMYVDQSDADWQEIVDQSVWMRIKKWRYFGGSLNQAAKDWLIAHTQGKPERPIQADDRDEFAHYIEVGNTHRGSGTVLPRDRKLLVDALANRPDDDWDYADDWLDLCLKQPRRAITALMQLARTGSWRVDVWREALNSFRDNATAKLSWRYLRQSVLAAPVDFIAGISGALSIWLQTASKFSGSQPHDLYVLFDRIINASQDDHKAPNRPVTRALNHEAGQATEALLNWWYTTQPKAGEGLPQGLETRFTNATQQRAQKYLYCRVILAAHLHALYLVAPEWTTVNLLPFFNWDANPEEAKSVWMGFLWTPRISPQLLDAFKADFLETAAHYADLGDHGQQYAGFLAYVAAQLRDHFSKSELIATFKALPAAGLAKASSSLSQMMGDAGNTIEKRLDTWSRQVKPLLTEAWPKSQDRRSEAESGNLATVLILSGDFEKAFPAFQDLITRTDHYYLPLLSLTNSDLPERFPALVLEFLGRLIGDQGVPDSTLRPVLRRILVAAPALDQDAQYRRLDEYLQLGRE